MRKTWIAAAFAGATALGALALVGAQEDPADAPSAQESQERIDPTAQPIAFPHDVHAGDFGIDCQYCHFSAERSVSAGIPAVGTCMGCHAVVEGRENPGEVQKLREFNRRGEAIPWVRIYHVTDHVHFPHMRHVAADLDCSVCHGEVREMGVIEEVNQPLTMGWCVSCHVEQGAARDCTVCHY